MCKIYKTFKLQESGSRYLRKLEAALLKSDKLTNGCKLQTGGDGAGRRKVHNMPSANFLILSCIQYLLSKTVRKEGQFTKEL